MTRLFALILISLLTLNFTTVEHGHTVTEEVKVERAEFESFILKNGLYVADQEKMAPAFFIDKDLHQWMTTASIATSMAIGGEIFATTEGFKPGEGKVRNFLATSDEGKIEVIFRIDKEDEFTILSVKNEREDFDFWLKEGMVFKLETETIH